MKGKEGAALQGQIDGLVRLFTLWKKTTEQGRQPSEAIRSMLFSLYVPEATDLKASLSELSTAGHIRLHERSQWLRGRAVERGVPALFPVASIDLNLEGGDVSVCLRVALLYEAEREAEQESEVLAFGYRFESAEGADGAHPFPHAQFVKSWTIDGESFWFSGPEVPVPAFHANESHPAFPLRGDGTPVGLGISLLATLYGARFTRSILSLDRRLTSDFAETIDSVLT